MATMTSLTLLNASDAHQQAVASRFSSTRPIVYRKCNNVMNATWRELDRYGGNDASRFGSGNAMVQDSVRSSVRLANDLFQSYADSTIRVNPTLLYYGCMWLAAALVYAKSVSPLKIDTLGHGMPTTLSGGTRPLLDSTVTFKSGGRVHMLADVLAGSTLSGIKLTLMDLFKSIPELDYMLKDIGEPGTSAVAVIDYADSFSGAKYYAREEGRHLVSLRGLGKGPTADELRTELATYAALVGRGASLVDGTSQITWQATADEEAEFRTLFLTTRADQYFLERCLPGGIYVPEMVAQLVILYSLSNLARYHPRTWLAMVDGYTAEYRLVRDFIEVVEVKFPTLVLNELSEMTNIFF